MVRYGLEAEGQYKGEISLIVFSAADHSRVDAILRAHRRTAQHLWLEAMDGEAFDWVLIATLACRYHITVLMRGVDDLPPDDLNICLVWKAPAWLSGVEYIQVSTRMGHGWEFSRQSLDPYVYEQDEIWY